MLSSMQNNLVLLAVLWCNTFHPAPNFQSAVEAISKLDTLSRLAHQYVHPSLDLRYVQINEMLFHAYCAISLSQCPDWISLTVMIFPIPKLSSILPEIHARALVAACLLGEMTVEAYEKRLEPHETVVARFCFQLAQLYEMNGNVKGASKNYQRALAIWNHHGSQGEGQCWQIQMCMERASSKVAGVDRVGTKLVEEVKKVALEERRNDDGAYAFPEQWTQEKVAGKKKGKRKK